MAAGSLGVVFFTGLTAGGLSCLAVQGGLLASSVASQAEEDITNELREKPSQPSGGRGPEYEGAIQQLHSSGLSHKKRKKAIRRLKQQYPWQATPAAEESEAPETKKHVAQPILLFLVAKVVAYTLLGLLLGWLGSTLQLTPYMRAVMQIGIGIFMLGTALRMFNVHPIFRYFNIEPPKRVTRFIRRRAKNSDGQFVTPLFLGALTVLIPCGITQAMIALAIGSGNPVTGALIMFAFTIGTTPLFFGLAYLATRLGETMHAQFLKVVGVVVLILGLVSINTGLNLAGSPINLASATSFLKSSPPADTQTAASSSQPAGPAQAAPGAAQAPAADQTASSALTVKVANTSYSPNTLKAKAGQPVKLALETNGTTGCTRGFVIPSLKMQKTLPETGTTTIDLPPQKAGTLKFTCSMGMYRGEIKFS